MEFSAFLIMYPLLVLVLSVIGTVIFKNWFVMPLGTLAVFTFLAFTVYNPTLFTFVMIYTVISLIASFATDKLQEMLLR